MLVVNRARLDVLIVDQWPLNETRLHVVTKGGTPAFQ
jgi:hypothetical protein